MTPLRRRYIEDLQLKHFAPSTIKVGGHVYRFVVPVESRPRLVRLAPLYSSIRSIVTCLRQFANQSATDPPPLNLNKNCATCPFHGHCLHEAEETDSLTLLERMSRETD